MALGEILKNARVEKGLKPSDVAESTHMMVQIVESLEREDFRRIAAPIYGRGFVKLYAEFLELDPEPLIREFMELYDGARMPAVRTKRVDETCAPPVATPVTRTVSGPAPLAVPEHQTVQPRPLVRPVAVAHDAGVATAEKAAEPVASIREELAVAGGRAAPAEVASPADFEDAGFAAPLVVEPEEAYDESTEPDLFRPLRLRRRQAPEATAAHGTSAKDVWRRLPKLPIFKIGGRLDEKTDVDGQDDESHAKRHERIVSFVEGFAKLKNGIERNLPGALVPRKVWMLGGLGLLAVVLLGTGIRVLFKMTEGAVKEAPDAIIERVAPPPDLYID